MTEHPVPLLLDTREPSPHPWEAFLDVPSVRGTLETGDVSLPGCGQWIAVERKALNDLVACLSWQRDRFVKELQRATRIPEFCVVVEGTYQQLISGKYRSEMSPKAAWESVIALQAQHHIPFYFLGNHEIAATFVQSLLYRWHKEHTKVIIALNKASQKLTQKGEGA